MIFNDPFARSFIQLSRDGRSTQLGKSLATHVEQPTVVPRNPRLASGLLGLRTAFGRTIHSYLEKSSLLVATKIGRILAIAKHTANFVKNSGAVSLRLILPLVPR